MRSVVPDFFARLDRLHALFDELEQLLEGVRLTREASDPVASPRLRARVSAFGELLSSQLGMLVICASGTPCVRLDARRLLCSSESASQQEDDRFLMGYVEPVENPDLVQREISRSVGRLLGKEEDDGGTDLVTPWPMPAVITRLCQHASGATCLWVEAAATRAPH